MSAPRASRPFMPGYGTLGPDEGTGLLPWSWAEERLAASHDYWVVTLWPDGRPHCMPVWGVWDGEALWFSSGKRARKARNLAADPRCVATTDNPQEPVVIEGAGEAVSEVASIQRFLDRVNRKYETDYTMDFLGPELAVTVRVRPVWAFALTEEDFGGSPTRWVFEE